MLHSVWPLFPHTTAIATRDEDTIDPDRIEKVRGIVSEDFARISSTDDPFVILNLDEDATLDDANQRYERYEKFYRAENFQRLGDMDLTRKALHIRRAIAAGHPKSRRELLGVGRRLLP